MNLTDLTEMERRAMEAAIYLIVNADGRVGHKEREEVEALADELDDPELPARISAIGNRVSSIDDLVPLVANVEREDAREMIRTVLFDLAQADGERSNAENEVINLVTREWARR